MRLSLSVLVVSLWVGPGLAQNVSIYRNDLLTKSIEQILAEHPLPPKRDLQSTLIERSEGSSIHLVQIRTREKPHSHEIHDLLIILKKGKGVVHLGQSEQRMEMGDMVLIPRGVPHHFETTSDEIAVGIGIFTPPFDGKDIVPIRDLP